MARFFWRIEASRPADGVRHRYATSWLFVDITILVPAARIQRTSFFWAEPQGLSLALPIQGLEIWAV